jgi:hypothetical protein
LKSRIELASLSVTKISLIAGEQGNLISSFKIGNITNQQLAFKVKTTAPKCYVVKPNSGIIEPGAGKNATINIVLQSSASKTVRIHFLILKEGNQIQANRFLVMVTRFNGTAEQVSNIIRR